MCQFLFSKQLPEFDWNQCLVWGISLFLFSALRGWAGRQGGRADSGCVAASGVNGLFLLGLLGWESRGPDAPAPSERQLVSSAPDRFSLVGLVD